MLDMRGNWQRYAAIAIIVAIIVLLVVADLGRGIRPRTWAKQWRWF
jgi:hypothetical protein